MEVYRALWRRHPAGQPGCAGKSQAIRTRVYLFRYLRLPSSTEHVRLLLLLLWLCKRLNVSPAFLLSFTSPFASPCLPFPGVFPPPCPYLNSLSKLQYFYQPLSPSWLLCSTRDRGCFLGHDTFATSKDLHKGSIHGKRSASESPFGTASPPYPFSGPRRQVPE